MQTIRDFVVVSFFNNVTAFVPRPCVTKEPLDNIADAFHIGQIVSAVYLKHLNLDLPPISKIEAMTCLDIHVIYYFFSALYFVYFLHIFNNMLKYCEYK